MTDLALINELFPAPPASARQPNTIDQMGSEAFLTLMVAQLQNQDPTKPLDNMDFMGQLAQFGTVAGIQELNESFGGLASALGANQALQAANLVGRSVVTEGNVGLLRPVDTGEDGEPVLRLDATVAFNRAASAATLYIQDLNGRLVHATALPPGSGSDLAVYWDGRNDAGELSPPGQYRISVEAIVNDAPVTVPVYAHQQVESVAIRPGSGGIALNLASGQSVGLSAIRSIF